MKIWLMGFLLFIVRQMYGQEIDTLTMDEVKVSGFGLAQNQVTTKMVEVIRSDFLESRFTGNLIQTISTVPGIQSMNIGSGFAKPMIRGMGFNRIVVSENGVKQEGQQWGEDHGLEIDAFNVESVRVLKGASSLQYGSDALGGAIEIDRPLIPDVDSWKVDVTSLYKSVNGTIGSSLMWQVKRNDWFAKARYTEQHFGDFRISTDTIVYLTRHIPVYGRLKNTAGLERDGHLFVAYSRGDYRMNLMGSNTYQKVGFFPGSHGIPNALTLQSDGDAYNVELPYSCVNHLKLSTLQQYVWGDWVFAGVCGFQENKREEWSLFHTHYASQLAPAVDPDLEFRFLLRTVSGSLKLDGYLSEQWKCTCGYDVQFQRNVIDGYSFLLPAYRRLTMGWYGVFEYQSKANWSVSGGVRYDDGRCKVASFEDLNVVSFLRQQGYSEEHVEEYRWRSCGVRRVLGDWSGSIGFSWLVDSERVLKVNVGRSFRLPGANELAANGVHHGTFRHEQGDAQLGSERGWQLDVLYRQESKRLMISVSPYLGYFNNYISLRPTGRWSVLPDAGQIYRYTGARALFVGVEADVRVKLCRNMEYQLLGEYTCSNNLNEHTALCYSPPASVRNVLSWHKKSIRLYLENHCIACQRRVARNENPTLGSVLFNGGGMLKISSMEMTFLIQNIANRKYFNHLSFYRQIEIPESGRNFQLLIKISIK